MTMSIYDHMTPDFLRQRLDFINHADLVVVETNLPEASLHWLCRHCTAPLLADPVSTIKAPKLQPVLGHLTALKPNRMEAELLSGVPIHNEADAAVRRKSCWTPACSRSTSPLAATAYTPPTGRAIPRGWPAPRSRSPTPPAAAMR